MGITSYFVNKTELVNNKYKKIINNILSEYNDKNIKTETEFLYSASMATKYFMENLSSPLFKYCEARSTPISEHFNIMVNNAIDDIDVLLNEAVGIAENINSINNEILSYIRMLDTTSNKLVKTINQLEDNINDIKDDKHYIFSDTFDDNSKSLLQAGTETCKVDISKGILTLNTEIERDYTSSVRLSVDEESNGFPGNTHEIEVLNNKYTFLGENEPYVNMYNVCDGKASTWFEYEAYHIPDEEYFKCNGFGFNYKEGISWLLDGDELTLTLKVSFDETKMCNWFTLTPFVPVDKNAKPSNISKVVIFDGKFYTQEININKEFSDSIIVSFEPQEVREITVYITQKYSYETDIGHFYTLKIDKNTNSFDRIVKENYRRLDVYSPSVELLGIKYDPTLRTFTQPNYNHIKDTSINSNIIKNELFTVQQVKNDYEYNDIEVIKGFRYSVAIKNIYLADCIFNEKGVYCSKPYETEENIVSVELEADDYIPTNFSDSIVTPDYHPNKFLMYQISFDNGNLWYEINPKHRVTYGPCCYNINSAVLPSMRNPKNVNYIDRVLDTKSVMLRIIMNRPEGLIYDSPIVYKYKLNIITEDDEFENI